MKILIGTKHFDYLSGAALHAYELSRVLTKRGNEVIVTGAIGGVLKDKAEANGVKLIPLNEVYKIRLEDFDALFLSQPSITAYVLSLGIKSRTIVQTCHSEWNSEDPYVSNKVTGYVAIRPQIKERLVKDFGIHDDRIAVIYNGVDLSRFNRDGASDPSERSTLFVGTVDGIRKDAALDLLTRSKAEGFKVRFIGKKFGNHLDQAGAEWSDERWDIETETKRCTETAGVLLGRTTIEGWACGKPGIIYDVDLMGRIKSVETHRPPEDMTPFDAETMTDEYLKLVA